MALIAWSAGAAAEPDTPRLPRPRPAVEQPSPTGEWAAHLQSRFGSASAELEDVPAAEQVTPPARSAFDAIDEVARLPHPRPDRPVELLAMVPFHAPVEPPAAHRIPEPEDVACLARLDALGVAYAKAEPIDPDGACFVDHPLKVTAVGSGVSLAPETILNCRTAEALALWTRDVLVPTAREILGATPIRIEHSSAYVCRNRNNDPAAKLSEHAHANAIDIASVDFAEREPFHVADRDMETPEGQFQVTIRGGSCDRFTTVLGPRSNASHATHFHFDMAERRGGYRLCDLADTNFVGATEP